MVWMALRDTEAEPQPSIVMSHREPHKQRHTGPILIKLVFTWGTQDRYVKLLNFEMEVMNMLDTKVCKLHEEEKASVIKNWLG